MWLMQSFTVQPGSSVGVFHSDLVELRDQRAEAAHSFTSCSMTASLMSACRNGELLDVGREPGFDAGRGGRSSVGACRDERAGV